MVALGAAVVFAGPVQQAPAQSYPVKTVRIVVGFSAGGATDVTARLLAQQLTPLLGQQVLVENRTGASGAIATERVATSPPDGYNLLLMTAADTVLPAMRPKLPYNLERDFTPVSFVASAPFVLVVHPSVPAANVRDLIALARTRPEKMNYGSFGSGSSAHLMGEMFNLMAKTRVVHVPYKGAAESSMAVVSGQIDMSFVAVTTAQPQVKAGRLKAMGVTSARRSSLMPAVPTLDESGLKGYDRSGWYGIIGPAGLPREIVTLLHGAIAKTVNTPEMKQSFERQGLEGHAMTTEQFASYKQGEIARSAQLIKAIGLKSE